MDLTANLIKLPRPKSKNKKPRLMPIEGELYELIQKRLNLRRLDCPFVFHRNGRPVKRFDRAFKTAAKDISRRT